MLIQQQKKKNWEYYIRINKVAKIILYKYIAIFIIVTIGWLFISINRVYMHPIEYFKLKKLEIDRKYQEKYKKILNKLIFLKHSYTLKLNQEIEKIERKNEELDLDSLLDKL